MRRLFRWTPWPRARALAVPLLAALALHALWLAWSSLRSPRSAGVVPLQRPDDSPELLVFSRQPPEPIPDAGIPPPPPSTPPAPPPLPPRRANDPSPSRSSARPPQSRRPERRGRPTRARLPQVPPPKARGPRSAPSAPLASVPPPQALLRSSSAAERLEGEALQRWRDLWGGAAVAAGGEVRSLPLERLRAEGLDPQSGRVLHLDDALLLVWPEAETIWLLRTPLASRSTP